MDTQSEPVGAERDVSRDVSQPSDENFRFFFDDAPVAIQFLDAEGRFLNINQAWLDLLGYSREEVVGRWFGDFLAGDETELFRQRFSQFKELGEVHNVEFDLRHKDGRELTMSFDGRIHRDRNGVFQRTHCVMRDISRSKRNEAALKESEERYRRLFETDSSAILVVDCETKRFVDANAAAARLYGYDRLELLLMAVDDVSADPDVSRKAIDRAEGSVPFRCHRRKDGSAFPVEISGSYYESRGRRFHVAMIRDISKRIAAENDLRQAQLEYRMLFDTMIDGFAVHEIVCDAEGRPVDYRFLLANPAFERITGLKAAEIVGRTVKQVLPGVSPAWIDTYGRVALTGEPAFFEQYSRELERHFQVSAFCPVPGRFACVVEDITKRCEAEAAMRRSEAELLAIYDHAPIIMLLLDSERRVQRLNRAALQFVGGTQSEGLGIRAGEMIGCLNAHDSPQGCGFGPACTKCALRLAIADTTQTGRSHERFETRPSLVRGQLNKAAIMLVSTARVLVEGQPLVLVCIEDITERKQAEEHVREQAALLDVSTDAILLEDSSRTITYWSRGAEATYGWSAAEAVGRNYATLLYRSESPEIDSSWSTLMETGSWSGERRQVTKDDRDIVVHVRAQVIRDDSGRPKQVLVVTTDITEAKRLEAQYLRAQRLENLGSLSSGIAHDLNNVLTPIMMSVELLQPIVQTSKGKETVRLLADSARRGADIVQQLLLFGRGSDMARKELSLANVLDDIRRMVRETFPKSIDFSLEAPRDLWQIVGDRTQIYQVLLNFCVNARDAMPQGGRLTVTAENVRVDEHFAQKHHGAAPGPHVTIRVSDSGTGISPTILDKIFDPFFTTKPEGQGSGLGLATAMGIVRNHAGFITVQTREGFGSEFCAFLPACGAGSDTAAPTAALGRLRGHRELVLVVEDEESLRQMLELSLASNDYRVLMATNGADAVALFAQRVSHIRLVVTDVMMPVMDGLQVIHAIRRLRKDVPIVVISGLHSYNAAIQKLNDPQIHFLAKPFMVDQLLAVMRTALPKEKKHARKSSSR
jgi:PAS domain S-box-containing protein